MKMNCIKPGFFGYDYTDGRRTDFDSDNAQLIDNKTAIDIIQIGDSITDIWDLQAVLPAKKVINRGISGDQIIYIAKRFEADCIQLAPTFVLLQGGVNDLRGFLRTHPHITSASTQHFIDEIIQCYQSMVYCSLAVGIDVSIQSFIPNSEPEFMPYGITPIILTINKALKTLCQKHNITWIDYYTPLVDKNGVFEPLYTYDGLHPSQLGYDCMIKALQHAKNELFLL